MSQGIYSILSKHFLGETSQEEEQTIAQFKKENSLEYTMLSKLWKKEGISIENFDSEVALKKIKQTREPKGKIISLVNRKTWTKIASVAAVLLIGIFTTYYTSFYNPLITKTNTSHLAMKVDLSDGSTVWLNKNASVSFPKIFNESKRQVELKGEGFFEVTKNPQQPFVVSASNSQTTVLGTSFNVNSTSEFTEVSVVTGKVKVAIATDKNQHVILLPGQSGKVKNSQVISYENTNTNFLSWKTRRLKFEGTHLTEVIDELEGYFDTKIELKNYNTNCRFTGEFTNQSLAEVLEILSYTFELNYTKQQNTYLLEVKKCE